MTAALRTLGTLLALASVAQLVLARVFPVSADFSGFDSTLLLALVGLLAAAVAFAVPHVSARVAIVAGVATGLAAVLNMLLALVARGMDNLPRFIVTGAMLLLGIAVSALSATAKPAEARKRTSALPAVETMPVATGAGDGTKRCPDCAEEVQGAARVCRHCGYSFVSARSGGTTSGTSGFAVAALVFGLVWLGGAGALLAVVFGHMAKRDIRESNGSVSGSGMATAGLVLGYVGIAVLVLMVVVLLA